MRKMKPHLLHQITIAIAVSISIAFVGNADAKHVVFYHPMGSYSHRISLWPMVEKLVENGHHVTFISSYYPKNPLPNVTELVPEVLAKTANDFMQGGELDITKRISGYHAPCYDNLRPLGYITCEQFLDDPEVQKWLKSDPQVDLIVVDAYVSECILGLAYKAKAPFIFYAPTVMTGINYETFGFVPDTAGIPDMEQHYTPPLSFYERAVNLFQPIIWHFKMQSYYEDMGKLIREKMNLPDMPPLLDIVKNASLMMWSETPFEGYPHVLPPNWVTVGGMHCKEKTNPLPQDIEKIVQKGKDGFIYMSLGSAVVPGNLPESYQDAFLNAIRAFPNIQFIWKWIGKKPEAKKIPPNLHIGDWFPQQDILAHKRILAFVTQSGRPSTQEALFHGVPIIAMPVFEDQDYTAERIRDNGAGLLLEISTIKQSEFEDAIREITQNPKYKETVSRLSKLFRDRPIKPADEAYWWIDYIMRHNGNLDHFRTTSHKHTWYERRHLDVWAVIFAGIFIVAHVVFKIVWCVSMKILFSNGNDDEKMSPSSSKKEKKAKKLKRKDD